ncbi:cyclic lactone autoinducer peptide [Agathobacter sp.]
MKKEVANVILKFAEISAKKAASKNSPWNYYQPKEPQKLNSNKGTTGKDIN